MRVNIKSVKWLGLVVILQAKRVIFVPVLRGVLGKTQREWVCISELEQLIILLVVRLQMRLRVVQMLTVYGNP